MRADALPIRPASSRAELPLGAVAALFGPGYAPKGSERVELMDGQTCVAFAEVITRDTLRLVLDAADSIAADGRALTLRGPKGRLEAPSAEAIQSTLVLPEGIIRAWRLTAGALVAVQVGTLVLIQTRVEIGAEAHMRIDRALVLAAGKPDTGRWLPAGTPSPSIPPFAPSASVTANLVDAPEPLGRVITENDVRQARMQRRTIRVRPDQIVTPAARSLGRELGILDEGQSSNDTPR